MHNSSPSRQPNCIRGQAPTNDIDIKITKMPRELKVLSQSNGMGGRMRQCDNSRSYFPKDVTKTMSVETKEHHNSTVFASIKELSDTHNVLWKMIIDKTIWLVLPNGHHYAVERVDK